MASGKLREDIDEKYRPICPKCGVNYRSFNRFSPKDGRPLYKSICTSCEREKNGRMRTPKKGIKEAFYRKKRDLTCDICGFKAEHHCQLDVDHIDGNHDNNDPSNHQILCANCHRLKTLRNKDYKKK